MKSKKALVSDALTQVLFYGIKYKTSLVLYAGDNKKVNQTKYGWKEKNESKLTNK